MVVEKVEDLNATVLQDILRQSLGNPSILVTNVEDPEVLGGINDNYASDLRKIVVTVEGDKKRYLVIKAALQTAAAWGNVILGLFIFYRESFWFDTAIPELVKLVSAEQAQALMEVVPRVHYAYCNYQMEDISGGFLSRAITMTSKAKEKGIILMENLKEGGEDIYVDLKEIECTNGGGVKTAHMRMLLEGLAQFHGAWMVWIRRGEGMGDISKQQILNFFRQPAAYKWRWLWKLSIKRVMNYYTVLAEAKNDQSAKEKVEAFINSPESVDRFMKAFDYQDSKFKTMCHSDLWSSQIMFALHGDGSPKRVKILDYQGLVLGHPAQDIWGIIYSATDAEYRAAHLEDDLRAYYTVLSGYMDTTVDYTEFRQELEERRIMGMVMNGIFCVITLSPTKMPSPATETSKFSAAFKEILKAEDIPEDHPDLREIRRRMMSNMKEMVELGLI